MSLLSNSDAQIFLERLGVGDLDSSKHSLQDLTRLVLAFQEHIPFSSVGTMSTAVEDRHVPSLEEVVATGLRLEGGTCFEIHHFMCILLRVLGYKTDVLDGSYLPFPYLHTHTVLLVHNIRHPGDRHIVEVATGFPFFEPVPVDELPKTYFWAGLQVRYSREEGEQITRYHRKGDLLEDEEHIWSACGEWRKTFNFCLHPPVDFDFFVPHVKHIFVDEVEGNDFLYSIRAVRFPRVSNYNTNEGGDSCQCDSIINEQKEKLGTVPDKAHHLLAIRDNELLQGPMNNLKIEKIEDDDLVAQFEYHFPNLPRSKIIAATKRYFNKRQKS